MYNKTGLFVAEDVGVKLVDSVRGGQGGDESEGPDEQDCPIAETSGVLKRFPVCVHLRAWKHRVGLVLIWFSHIWKWALLLLLHCHFKNNIRKLLFETIIFTRSDYIFICLWISNTVKQHCVLLFMICVIYSFKIFWCNGSPLEDTKL